MSLNGDGDDDAGSARSGAPLRVPVPDEPAYRIKHDDTYVVFMSGALQSTLAVKGGSAPSATSVVTISQVGVSGVPNNSATALVDIGTWDPRKRTFTPLVAPDAGANEYVQADQKTVRGYLWHKNHVSEPTAPLVIDFGAHLANRAHAQVRMLADMWFTTRTCKIRPTTFARACDNARCRGLAAGWQVFGDAVDTTRPESQCIVVNVERPVSDKTTASRVSLRVPIVRSASSWSTGTQIAAFFAFVDEFVLARGARLFSEMETPADVDVCVATERGDLAVAHVDALTTASIMDHSDVLALATAAVAQNAAAFIVRFDVSGNVRTNAFKPAHADDKENGGGGANVNNLCVRFRTLTGTLPSVKTARDLFGQPVSFFFAVDVTKPAGKPNQAVALRDVIGAPDYPVAGAQETTPAAATTEKKQPKKSEPAASSASSSAKVSVAAEKKKKPAVDQKQAAATPPSRSLLDAVTSTTQRKPT